MDREKKKRMVRLCLCLGGLGAGALALAALQPPCLILKYTGFYCAGCGGSRMLLALLQGDLPTAFRQNPFLLVLLPALGIYLAAEGLRTVREKPPLVSGKSAAILAAGVVLAAGIFTVLRNLPGLELLRPV